VASSSAEFHEATEDLRPETRDRHRGIVSMMEELEAVDWYDQRIDAAGDEALQAILRHNRDEEKEHAAMLLEWLRRHDPSWDTHLRWYLFTEDPIADLAEAAEAAEVAGESGAPGGGGGRGPGGDGSLGLGGLSDKEML
jgi:ferritin-like protein